MSALHDELVSINLSNGFDVFIKIVETATKNAGYIVVEKNIDKPWGAYLRIDSRQAD